LPPKFAVAVFLNSQRQPNQQQRARAMNNDPHTDLIADELRQRIEDTDMTTATMKASELPAIGAELGGGYFAGIIWLATVGIKYALIVAGKDGEFSGEWGNYDKEIDGADSPWDGSSNTDAMIASGREIAQQIRALRIGGFNDWSIPARDQLEVIYRNLKPTKQKNYCWFLDGYNAHGIEQGERYTPEYPAQTPAEAFQEGNAAAFEAAWYWTSTQYSAGNAFCQGFADGDQDGHGKGNKLRARAVRMIQLSN